MAQESAEDSRPAVLGVGAQYHPQARPVPRLGAKDDDAREVWCLLGLPFDRCTMAQAKQVMRDAISDGRRLVLTTPNVNFVVSAANDPAFRETVMQSDFSVVDGMPLVWAARLLGVPLRERVPGSGLIEQLLNEHYEPALTSYFFGGTDAAGAQACARINERHGGLRAVGHYDPGYGSVEDMSTDAIIERVNAANPDLLLVSLGAKKGNTWIEHNRRRLNARVITHVGATLNFLAGTVQRAPPWMQRAGLEWLWRIAQEPPLWRRYVTDGIALSRLALTRLLPLYVLLKTKGGRYAHAAPLRVEVCETSTATTVTLRGVATHSTIFKLKPILHDVFNKAVGVVVVNIEALDYVDSACIGLFFTVHKQAFENRCRLSMHGASPFIRRLFHLHGAQFLLDRP